MTYFCSCLSDVKTRMHGWSLLKKTQAFVRQAEIKRDIEACHAAISDCLTKFQVSSGEVMLTNCLDSDPYHVDHFASRNKRMAGRVCYEC